MNYSNRGKKQGRQKKREKYKIKKERKVNVQEIFPYYSYDE
jgi:hypothetical protein